MHKKHVFLLQGLLSCLVLAIVAGIGSGVPQRIFVMPGLAQYSSSTSFSSYSLSTSSYSSFTQSSTSSESSSSSSSDSSETSSESSSSSFSDSSETSSESSSSSFSDSSEVSSTSSGESSESSEGGTETILPVRLFCGDKTCSSEMTTEACKTCPYDCGLCAPKVECGDDVCAGESDCESDCHWESMTFPSSPGGRSSTSSSRHSSSSSSSSRTQVEGEPEISLTLEQILAELATAIRRDVSFTKRVSEGGSIEYFAEREAIRDYILRIANDLQNEGDTFRGMVFQDILSTESVLRLISTLPLREKLIQQAKLGNIKMVRPLLPPPVRTVEERMVELMEYDQFLQENFPEAFVASRHSFLFLKAVAQEVTEAIPDAKGALVKSAFLRMRMEALGLDPNTGLPTLEQDMQNLQKRKNVLAGIFGTVESDADEKLDEAEEKLKDPTAKNLISMRGLFSYISTTANFEAMEQKYSRALTNMRTGFGKIRALFAWGDISPRVEAATLVGEELAPGLSNADVTEQAKNVSQLFVEMEERVQPLLAELPEEEAGEYRKIFSALRRKAEGAESIGDLEKTIALFTDSLKELETDARDQHSILSRPLEALKNFLHRS